MTPDERPDARDGAQPQRGAGPRETRLGRILSPLEDPRVSAAISGLVVGGVAQVSGGLPWSEPDKKPAPGPDKAPDDAPDLPDSGLLVWGSGEEQRPHDSQQISDDPGAHDDGTADLGIDPHGV